MEKVAYIFPGQGVLPREVTQLPYWQRERFRQTFEEASEVLGINLLDIFLQPQKRALLNEGVIARPAVVTFNVACLKVLNEQTHLTPVVVAGHSVGEYSALVAAGALQLTDAVKAAQEIAALIQSYFPNSSGLMAAIVGLQPAAVEQLCAEVCKKEFVAPAAYNSHIQVVISGYRNAVTEVMQKALKRGAKRVQLLPICGPYHTPLLQPLMQEIEAIIARLPLQSFKVPVLSNDEVNYLSSENARKLLAEHTMRPVRWQQVMEFLTSSDLHGIVEVGPMRLLSKFFKNSKIEIRHFEELIEN